MYKKVFTLMTVVPLSLGLFPGVQPSINTSSCGPTVAPLGEQAASGTTPVSVVESLAPSVVSPPIVLGSTTSNPPCS